MTDPLDVLRAADTPVDPDPSFARDLRARLERALLHPQEDPMPATTETADTTGTPAAAALRLHAVTPYLAVAGAAAAVEFYVTAFGAARRGEPIVMPDGRVGHVEVALGDSVLMMADEFPEMGLVAPVNSGGVSQSLRLEVADPDTVVRRAVAAGARLERPVTDSPYGRGGVVLDPSGHRWMVSAAVPQARPGDVVYASLWTPDADRAARFYGAVLGWEVGPGSATGARQVANLGTPLGIFGGQPRGAVFLCYAVPDVDAAVAVVRAAGGAAGEPTEEPYGRVANCTDDQGVPFAVMSAGGAATSALDHVEFRVPDATRARAFYSAVLGWRFTPVDEPGYWNGHLDGEHTHPRTGLSGGHDPATTVPTFAVSDVPAAVVGVREAGGTAAEAAREPYGWTAACVDDQGTPFVLRQR